MAKGTRTKKISWNALVRKQGDSRTEDSPEYRFSNGRKFKRAEKRGVYKP